MPSSAAVRRIVFIGPDKPLYKEGTAFEAIMPGSIIDRRPDGTVENNDVTGLAPVTVAVENDIFGKGRDDTWAVGDTVLFQHLRSGCEFDGLVAAGAAAIVYDDFITMAADGTLAKGTQANAIGRARAALDNSAGGAKARLAVLVN